MNSEHRLSCLTVIARHDQREPRPAPCAETGLSEVYLGAVAGDPLLAADAANDLGLCLHNNRAANMGVAVDLPAEGRILDLLARLDRLHAVNASAAVVLRHKAHVAHKSIPRTAYRTRPQPSESTLRPPGGKRSERYAAEGGARAGRLFDGDVRLGVERGDGDRGRDDHSCR